MGWLAWTGPQECRQGRVIALRSQEDTEIGSPWIALGLPWDCPRGYRIVACVRVLPKRALINATTMESPHTGFI